MIETHTEEGKKVGEGIKAGISKGQPPRVLKSHENSRRGISMKGGKPSVAGLLLQAHEH